MSGDIRNVQHFIGGHGKGITSASSLLDRRSGRWRAVQSSIFWQTVIVRFPTYTVLVLQYTGGADDDAVERIQQ
ncbi:MAG: hypothetical protein ACSLEM_02120 [Candidatus Malihini olakiniferum]